MAVAAGRVALGLAALAWPSVPARPWVGAAADDLAARVFGRALGARDVALGLGALAALQLPAAGPGSASAWVAAGALSDALDVAASLASWHDLPRVTRWLVVASAGGAALAGAAAALAGAAGVWVPSESDKQALVQDQASPFFTTSHFDGHPSVLVRGSRIGELTLRELAEVIQDAWLSRASPARAAAWLSAQRAG